MRYNFFAFGFSADSPSGVVLMSVAGARKRRLAAGLPYPPRVDRHAGLVSHLGVAVQSIVLKPLRLTVLPVRQPKVYSANARFPQKPGTIRGLATFPGWHDAVFSAHTPAPDR